MGSAYVKNLIKFHNIFFINCQSVDKGGGRVWCQAMWIIYIFVKRAGFYFFFIFFFYTYLVLFGLFEEC